MAAEAAFPLKAVVFAGAVALAAGAIALFCVLTLLSFMEDPSFIEFNGHVVGGSFDKAVATALALFFGTVAVVALLTCRRLVAECHVVKNGAREPR
jgi:hypothetical protein